MNATLPRLPSGPSLTGRSFAVLRAAASGCKDAHAEQPETATVPTAAALRADGDLVQRAYDALHPGLYRYNTPAEMREHFDALRKELAAAASFSDWQAGAYLALARTTAAVRCGHTYANFYNQSGAVRRNLLEGTNRVPCEFRWLDGRMGVTRDLSTEQRLPVGAQIVGIPGASTPELPRRLLSLTRADGSNDATRIALLEVRALERYETFDVLPALTTPAMSLDICFARRHGPPGNADLEPYLDTWDPSFRHRGAGAQRVDRRYFKLQGDDESDGHAPILPRKPRFAGKAFALIGPDNSSATIQFAERARASGPATLVGQATGGTLRDINGGAFFFLKLPACGPEVDVPLIERFAPGNPPDARLAPDVEVRPTFEPVVHRAGSGDGGRSAAPWLTR